MEHFLVRRKTKYVVSKGVSGSRKTETLRRHPISVSRQSRPT